MAWGQNKLPLPGPAQATLGQAAPAHLCGHTGEEGDTHGVNTHSSALTEALPTDALHHSCSQSRWSQSPALSQQQSQQR